MIETHMIVQQQQNVAFQVTIARALHLESVRFVALLRAMPLDQMIVWSIQILVQLDHQRLEEAAEFSLRQL